MIARRLLLVVLTIVSLTSVAYSDDPLVVVTSQKFGKPVLDTESLRQHKQTSKPSSYVVDTTGQTEVVSKIAKKLLREAGIDADIVHSFIMKAQQFQPALQAVVAPQNIEISELISKLQAAPEAIIYFVNGRRQTHRLLEQTTVGQQSDTSGRSQLFANMTPSVLSGLFVALFLLVMLCIAVSCLFDIKTNDRFASTNLFVGKQS